MVLYLVKDSIIFPKIVLYLQRKYYIGKNTALDEILLTNPGG